MAMLNSGRFALALVAALMLAACAGQNQDSSGLSPGVGAAAPGSLQDFSVNVGDRVFFLEDQSTLTGEAQATLEKQAAWLKQYPRYSFLVEGHADERGTREYNLALGARRAAAVRDFLSTRGVEATRLRTISYGKERPVAVCNEETCWNQNRRAVTVLSGQ